MYTNDLNSAYLYESERRNDESRAALESERSRGLYKNRKAGIPSPMVMTGILVLLVAILRGL
jgi:hypothetical protein